MLNTTIINVLNYSSRVKDKIRSNWDVILWDGFGLILGSLGVLLGTYLLVRKMSPNTFGQLSAVMTMAFLTQIYFSCSYNAFFRYFSSALEKNQQRPFYETFHYFCRQGVWYHLLVTVVICSILYLCGAKRWLETAFFGSMLGLIGGFSILLSSLQIALRQRKVNAFVRAGMPWARTFFAIAMITWCGDYLDISASGYVIGTIVILLPQIYIHYKTYLHHCADQPASDPVVFEKWKQKTIYFTKPYFLFYILGYVQLYIDRWAITLCIPDSNSELGIYSAYYLMGYTPMILLMGYLSQLIYPVLMKLAGDGSDHVQVTRALKGMKEMFYLSLGVTLVCTTLAFFISKPLVEWLLPEVYWKYEFFLPGIIFAGGCYGIGQTSSYVSIMLSKPHAMVRFQLISATTTIILSFTSAYFWGLKGVLVVFPIYALTNAIILSMGKKILITEHTQEAPILKLNVTDNQSSSRSAA